MPSAVCRAAVQECGGRNPQDVREQGARATAAHRRGGVPVLTRECDSGESRSPLCHPSLLMGLVEAVSASTGNPRLRPKRHESEPETGNGHSGTEPRAGGTL